MNKTELILNAKGHIYHLDLSPDMLAPVCITVGDPNRVNDVSKYFDHIDIKRSYREFVTHTGNIGSKRIMVISTGIGTDNVDIVLTELDALLNVDLSSTQIKSTLQSLDIIRIGTSGTFHPDIPVDSIVVNTHAVGLDLLMTYYPDYKIVIPEEVRDQIASTMSHIFHDAYWSIADNALVQLFNKGIKGIAITCNGFYGPQGRQIRLKSSLLNEFIQEFYKIHYKNIPFTNFEMETAGIYALGAALGHRCVSINTILANRNYGKFSSNPAKAIDNNIKYVLETICSD